MAIIGIDLGTTNSLVAFWRDKEARIIPNVLGRNITPSIVSIDEENGDILVGEVAKERLLTHPHLTASNFKRFMGTEKIYNLGNYSFKAEELSSFILKSLKEDAEKYLNDEISEVVISVPAYFNEAQRKATKIAGELAGLKVERLISEPTAAAMAYGLYQEKDETQFLVFDLGGGTFDVSILELFEGVSEVKSVAGDNYLGGEDFDRAIVEYFLDKNSLHLSMLNDKERAILYKQAEFCKRSITEGVIGDIKVQVSGQEYTVSINENVFEEICKQLISRLRNPVERALRDAELSPHNIDSIVLIGGSTRMPLVKTVVSKMFGKLPFCSINPDETVGLGAAIQCGLKSKDASLKEVILTDVCAYTLGIGAYNESDISNSYFVPIIERNSPIPISRIEEDFTTIADNQTKIHINIYQGESRYVKNNIKLGEVIIEVPSAPKGQERISVRFTYDINSLLEVEVVSATTGKKQVAVIEQMPGVMTEDEIKKRLEALKTIKIHPRDRLENRLIIARAERLYEEFLGEKREIVAWLLQQFESVLKTQNQYKIEKAAKEIKIKLDNLEQHY